MKIQTESSQKVSPIFPQPVPIKKNLSYIRGKLYIMLETNITEAANIFLWIVCIGIGLVIGLTTIDVYKSDKEDTSEPS